MDEFRNLLEEMELVNVSTIDYKYTWFNATSNSMSKLDMILLNERLISLWKVVGKFVGQRYISDHWPIWLKTSNLDWGPKPFMFNNCWLGHKDLVKFVDK